MMKLNPRWMRGKVWDECGKSRIVQILISHGESTIFSFQFAYVDEKGDLRHSPIYGEPKGWKFNIVTFDYPSEFLTSMSGAYENNSEELGVIAFGSNKRMYGPFGKTKAGDAPEFAALDDSYISYCKFNYEFGAGSFFAGFHGSVHNSIVSAIGIYIEPITSLAQVKLVNSHVIEPEPNEKRLNPIPLSHFPKSTSNNINRLAFVGK